MEKLLIDKKFYVTVFFILSIVIYKSVMYEQDKSIDKFLDEKSKQNLLNYQVIYNDYKSLSELVFQTLVNNQQVVGLFEKRDREGLKNYLQTNYSKLREFNIRQLHFHLANNESFLRMHRPNKFGDNLTKARETVRYVNEHKKYIDGFEEGKIFNGFRFVYPLFSKTREHLGSVEVSFSALFFIKEIIKSYNVTANFLIDKAVVDEKVFKDEKFNYILSPLGEFYYQKSILENLNYNKYQRKLPKEFKKLLLTYLDSKELFSLYVKEFQEIVTFIPIENPITKKVVAYLKINSQDSWIERKQKTAIIWCFILELVLILILLLIYKQLLYQRHLEDAVDEKTKELNEFNQHLENMVADEVEKNKKKDELMIVQSRQAAMGEMISMIAHQWRQPLAAISMSANNLILDVELDTLNNKVVTETSKDILDQTGYLTKTIDDFRDFFKPKKKQEIINVIDVIEEALKIVGTSLENNNIRLDFDAKINSKISTYSRELLQVLLNIIKNGKDVLEERKEDNRNIGISCREDEEWITIEIFDNGGGIPEQHLDKIFEPYFSTKDEKNGTGLGLHMSKIIIEKHLKGALLVTNKDNGACFTIKLPKKI